MISPSLKPLLLDAINFHCGILKNKKKEFSKENLMENISPFRSALIKRFGGDLENSAMASKFSSSEETILGHMVEKIAIIINNHYKNGFKSSRPGIDLEYYDSPNYYLISIKSGIRWGNSSSISKLSEDFTIAINELRSEYNSIIPVNGCCYGKPKIKFKKKEGYYLWVGKSFWENISGQENMYEDIIQLINDPDNIIVNYLKDPQ